MNAQDDPGGEGVACARRAAYLLAGQPNGALPPGAAATQPAGKCTTASTDTPRSIMLSAIASSASAITKSSGVYRPAAILLSLRSRRRTGRAGTATPAGVDTDSFNLPIGLPHRRSWLSDLVPG